MRYIVGIFVPLFVFAFTATTQAATPLSGHTIGLDAGHGNGETGAVGYCNDVAVPESEVNRAVRSELAARIEADGATAYEIAQLPTRKERVADAEAGGSEVLISIHHNGSSDTATDYTRSFVTQKNDREFAKFIHPALVDALGTDDRGIKNDGYGMTVYGSLPGVLTESYFITNTQNACDYLDYVADPSDTTTRVHTEAQALYDGLLAYFGSDTGNSDDGEGGNGNGGGKPEKCSPWPGCKNQ